MHLFLFIILAAAVSAVNALIKPVPRGKALREGLLMFLTTSLGMGAAALLVHFASM
jgi:hypothetical protein